MLEDFFKIVIDLKGIQRKGWKNKLALENVESVADHSYSMTLMAMILSDLQGLDTKKIMKMSLLHDLVESVLEMEKVLTLQSGLDKKFSYELRNKTLIKTYSRNFCSEYNRVLAGQVEGRLKTSIKMVADFWYTSWIEAGQPALSIIKFLDSSIIL